MRPILLVASFVLAAAPLGAQQPASPPAASPAAPAPLPSVALPPELDRVLRDYERGWRAGDVAAVAQLFTPDGFVLSNNQLPVRGRAAVEQAYRGQRGPLTLRALAFATGDTVGYIIGAYTYDPAAGDQGKFTITLRRAPDGRWLIASDMDNPIQPPRRPSAAPGQRP
jgi:ketosteroid isomerase-like protein